MGRYRKDRKRWQSNVVDHAGKRWIRHFMTKADMEEFEYAKKRSRMRIKAGLEIAFEPMTLRDFLALWKPRRMRGKKSSWAGEIQKLDSFWLPRLGDEKMHTLSKGRLERELEALIADGLSPAYRNRHRSLLHKIWEDAKEWDPPCVSLNPVTAIDILSEKLRVRPHGYLEIAEMHILIGKAKERGPQWAVLYSLLCFSGLRIGEAIVLKWGDVDSLRSAIKVERIWEIASKSIKYRTKGQREEGSFEHVVILKELDEILAAWRDASKFSHDHDWVVCNEVGGHYTYWQVERVHNRILKAAGLSGVTLHGLRHTFGRYARSLGFQGDDLKGLMRHKDVRVTEIYSPVDMRHLAERAMKLNEVRK